MQYSTVLTTSGDVTAAGTGTVELEASVGGLCFCRYSQQIVRCSSGEYSCQLHCMTHADIQSYYSVTVTFTAGGLILAFEVDDDDDDDNAFEQR